MDNRLTLISKMVKPCSNAADIGTDHGFLICGLVEQGTVQRGIAADINPLPLDKAKREIALRGLGDRVEAICTDGLNGIGRQDAVVIAGMGGELIASIIDRWEYRTDRDITFYLQPMTKAERLREWLFEQGYDIVRECCCVANRRPYSVIEAVYVGQSINYLPVELYLGRVDPRAGEWELAYCKRVRSRVARTLAGLTAGSGKPAELDYWQCLLTEIDRRIAE